MESKTVEFTCGCGQRLRFVCHPKPGGVPARMGCCETIRLPGDYVQILALLGSQWIPVHEGKSWIESGAHRLPVHKT